MDNCKHGNGQDCQQCQYELDAERYPEPWKLYEWGQSLKHVCDEVVNPESQTAIALRPIIRRRSDADEMIKEWERKTIWENIDKKRKDEAHYSIMRLDGTETGMNALRGMFPNAKANELNFVLFSTSGVHGTYQTIEESEAFLNGEDPDGFAEITFLIVHPRLVALRFGTCTPINQADIDFLKRLRESSRGAIFCYFDTPQNADKCATCRHDYEPKEAEARKD
jgi:hypothetical protein